MNAKLDSGVTTRPVTRQTFDEVLVPTYAPAAMVPVRAAGLDVWDQEGKHYLDFTSGIAVSSLGHANPMLVDALTKQLNTLWHLGNGYTNEPVLRLGLALTEATFADRAFFCNSGAEANEAALKLARKYAHTKFGPHKSRIVSCLSSFHGRTLFTVSVGGQPKYTEGFEPLIVPTLEGTMKMESGGRSEQEPFELHAIERNAFRGEFTASVPGSYSFATTRDPEGIVKFEVVDARPERTQTALDEKLLKAMAENSGGLFFREENLSELPDKIAAKSATVASFKKLDLFHNGWLLTALLGFLFLEWLLRRLTQLK